AVVAGFNAPNRVIIGRNVRPGQKIQLAVFGMNGPISASPNNFIWVKSATLDFYKAAEPGPNVGEVVRLDPALDAIVPTPARIEKLAAGFLFTEGPVWVRDGGYLLFSDPNDNRIYRWTPDGDLSVFRTKSGYTGPDIADYGKRLNSPNDLVYKSDGSLYFTDPPFGLPKFFDDARKELPYSGVFRVADGKVQLLTTDLTGPNGLAFSPDEKYLYVDDWDVKKKVVMRYRVERDGTLSHGDVFFDMTSEPGEQALDGMKVDQKGNLYVSGPGGVWIISPAGRHLGTIKAPELPANMAWGDEDGRTLYMTARTSLYRVRLKIPGVRR